MREVAHFSNMLLAEKVSKLPNNIMVGSSSDIECFDRLQQDDLFGEGGDGIHMRGPRGPELHTSSVRAAIRRAGMGVSASKIINI